MPCRCCVTGCKSNYESEKTHVSVFSFPKDEEMRKKWISVISRKNWTPTKRTVVCAFHFHDTDITRYETWPMPDGSIKKSLLKRPKLKNTAIPSIFPNIKKYSLKSVTSLRSSPDSDKTPMFAYTSPKINERRSKIQTNVDGSEGFSVADTENVPGTSRGCGIPFDSIYRSRILPIAAQLENDMENYMPYKLMGSVKRIRIKPNCIPSRFDCQTNRSIMPQWCSVPYCSSRISGHRFPKESALRKAWIIAIRRDTFTPSDHSRVCNKHFVEDDYVMPKDSVRQNPKPLLRKGSIPSRFQWSEVETDKKAVIKQGKNKFLTTKEKPGGAPEAILNSDNSDPLELNNLLLSTISIFQGMCKELELSVITNKQVDNQNADKEQIMLTTSAGDGEQSFQFVNGNKKPEDATPSLSESTDDLERMLYDVESTVMSAEEYQEAIDTRTMSTQTDNVYLEVENKRLKLENAALKKHILGLQNPIQLQGFRVSQIMFQKREIASIQLPPGQKPPNYKYKKQPFYTKIR